MSFSLNHSSTKRDTPILKILLGSCLALISSSAFASQTFFFAKHVNTSADFTLEHKSGLKLDVDKSAHNGYEVGIEHFFTDYFSATFSYKDYGDKKINDHIALLEKIPKVKKYFPEYLEPVMVKGKSVNLYGKFRYPSYIVKPFVFGGVEFAEVSVDNKRLSGPAPTLGVGVDISLGKNVEATVSYNKLFDVAKTGYNLDFISAGIKYSFF